MNPLPIHHRAPGRRLAIIGRVFERDGQIAVRSYTVNQIVLAAKNLRILGIAQSGRALGKRI